MNSLDSRRKKPSFSGMPLWFRIGLPFLVIAMGTGLGLYFLGTQPEAIRRPVGKALPLVSVAPIYRDTAMESIFVMGTVSAEKAVVLRASVSGTILSMSRNFSPGNILTEGEMLLRIDPKEYRIAVEKAEATLERVKADLDLEKGRVAMAEAEIKSLEKITGKPFATTELTLRKPQQQQIEASLAEAEADLALARVQLERTKVAAPFDAVLTQRHVVTGDRVGVGDALATLVGRERFWIEARVPLDRTAFLRQEGDPDGPSRARIQGLLGTREGYVSKLFPDLAQGARMARILVVLEDPMGIMTTAPPVFIGDYLSMELEGRSLEGGFRIPAGSLREGRQVWLVDGEERLRMIPVIPVFSDDEGSYILSEQIPDGALLVTSDLGLVIDGMQVETEKSLSPASGETADAE